MFAAMRSRSPPLLLGARATSEPSIRHPVERLRHRADWLCRFILMRYKVRRALPRAFLSRCGSRARDAEDQHLLRRAATRLAISAPHAGDDGARCGSTRRRGLLSRTRKDCAAG